MNTQGGRESSRRIAYKWYVMNILVAGQRVRLSGGWLLKVGTECLRSVLQEREGE